MLRPSLARRSSRLFDEAAPPPTSGVRGVAFARHVWRGGEGRDFVRRRVPWRASRRWRAEFGIARSPRELPESPPYAIDATRHRRDTQSTRLTSAIARRRRTLPPNADGKKPTLVQLKYGGYGSSKTRTLRLLGDRTFLNTLEQAPPFLVSLWACGLLADVELAAFCGKGYIFFRCLYPIVFRKGMPWLLLSTVPCYNLIWYMLFRAVVACA